MGTWAGTDDMRAVEVRPKAGGSRFKRLSDSQDQPAPDSVHLVDDDAGTTACGMADPARLTRLDKPWDEWLPVYRHRQCREARPDA